MHLLHGRNDDLIPFTETLGLARRLADQWPGAPPQVTITSPQSGFTLRIPSTDPVICSVAAQSEAGLRVLRIWAYLPSGGAESLPSTREAQQPVTGEVTLALYKGNLMVDSRKSPNSLYDEGIATMEGGGSYNQLNNRDFVSASISYSF